MGKDTHVLPWRYRYTIESPPDTWLRFLPRHSDLGVEHFQVDVETCRNTTVYRLENRTGIRTTNEEGEALDEEDWAAFEYNATVNYTLAVCEPLMEVPAANPCPWSRDCTLLGEVSFKLRAYAMLPGWADSATTAGLFTFIEPGACRIATTPHHERHYTLGAVGAHRTRFPKLDEHEGQLRRMAPVLRPPACEVRRQRTDR